MGHFVIIVNDWKPLTIITKSSILDVGAVLDPLLATILEPMATKLDRMVIYFDGFLLIISHDPLITWSCKVT